MITRINQQSFEKALIKFFAPIFDTIITNDASRLVYQVDTIYGPLNMTIYKDDDSKNLYSLFGRFIDGELYKKNTNIMMNKYSGKFNFHGSNKMLLLNHIKSEINEILITGEVE